ncbi:Oleic acid lipoxygenase precursor [Mycobacteroides abscessus subsp. abscessus]|uniref:lipoxygenase family protein n=1 Tax=Mycobacteroides abscessus TaxID=36809 RepID=UPI00092A3CB1|nr:lipoxygenase family protein [Mycobacteroides abscessus]MDO3217944.1 lipoxygenase family protein [Mycobacteroides abscessus subsp. abscessus]SHS93496.1 Oleic acid lipoxygenase precursor [Mycobacteroides abscessus subsp. abscessus]SIK82080.1 Oleic acid lipoxygenase precursor [Mycobacteroides abscessus subsp. abscessus]SKU56017.1 Oleic acid lipoxygenase precursor [Mycobacteroides abscessus subsp. abscessus]SKY32778.1 Oleic acid lipoxygenase precursor [Mycobacteroides abscessus subsp. abscessus
MEKKQDYLISQHDSKKDERQQIRESIRSKYNYRMDYGVPVADSLPDEALPAPEWNAKTLLFQSFLHLNMRSLVRSGKFPVSGDLPELKPLTLARLIKARDSRSILHYFTPKMTVAEPQNRATSFDDFKAVYAHAPLPAVSETFDTDAAFAENFVAGPDPTRIRLMERVHEKFPITNEHLNAAPGLEGVELTAAINAGRVFWVDHEVNLSLDNGRHPLGEKYMYAPMAAFYAAEDGKSLIPFAIQCGQDPAGRRIYTPADGYSWKLAKNCVLVAQNAYHEVITHLGLTHLLTEPILLSTVRNLAPNHPVAALLGNHFEGTISINRLAVDILIQPGEAVDLLVGASLPSLYELLDQERRSYSYRDNYLPARFKRYKTDNAKTLEHYPYRDDGMEVWNSIAKWVSEFVGTYYRSDEEVRADIELQAWAQEISSPEWGQVSGFGDVPGQVSDRQDLVEILTMVIWTAGPQHGAVNFSQAPCMGFLPANPLAGYTPEPTGSGHTEADWMENFPSIDMAILQFNTMSFLSSVNYTRLGHYGSTFAGTKVEKKEYEFRADLVRVEYENKTRDEARAVSYPYLLPSQIPQSTNI